MRDVFLTGATGFLGGELAVALSKINSIDHVYCLVRDKAGERAADRLESVFRFHGDDYDSNRVRPVSGDLNDPLLDERLKSNADIRGVTSSSTPAPTLLSCHRNIRPCWARISKAPSGSPNGPKRCGRSKPLLISERRR